MQPQPLNGPVLGLQVPTRAQVEEVEKVRGMQVRTEAAKLAAQVYAGRAPTPAELLGLAGDIEDYILGV